MDQEMAANEATQSSAPEDHIAEQTNVEDASTAIAGDDAAVAP